jgi:citrate synthase
MKGMIGMVTETSKLDAEEGIRFRGYSIPELREKLPKVPGGTEPLPEGIFYLMLIGEMPTDEDVKEISRQWIERSNVPDHVFETLDALPKNTHPMTKLSIGILAMQTESVFAAEYRKGINKKNYWDPTYEDVMNLIARLPVVAAYIYRTLYKDRKRVKPDPSLDWAGNFANMLGYDDPDFKKMMRLYLTIHADHEGGNVSAHATHLVGSALSDAYYSLSAGMNGLAGPLHGLANQEVVRWILELREYYGGSIPTKEQIEEYVNKTLDEGKVIPGYGHAVLRKTDPRFIAQNEFARKHMPDDELFKIVQLLYEVVPKVLLATGKVKNPWPNVDAHSGALLIHYGMKEYDFYTVLFGVSRAMGVLAQLLWDRVLSSPLERPGSVTTENMMSMVKRTFVEKEPVKQ